MARTSPAHRRYVLRLAVAMGTYLITLALAVRLFRDGQPSGSVAWMLALLPGLSVAAVFWAVGRLLVEETDEYVRMLLVRQTLIATGITLSLATIYGFLENFGLVPHIDAFYIAILWFAGLGVGAAVNRITMGHAGTCA